MEWRQIVDRVVRELEDEPSVEGVFLGGSLVTDTWDEFSDIDMGVATADGEEPLERAYALRHRLAATVGSPVHAQEKAWDHSRMISLLYGKAQFPPIGLELDVFFGQLRYITELMPGARFGVVFDRNGRLGAELERIDHTHRREGVRRDLLQGLVAFPFDVNHAVKAHARGDLFNYQFVVERMRAAIFSAAASRQGGVVRGSKRASLYLSVPEQETVLRSYCDFSREAIRELTQFYLSLLDQVQSEYGIERETAELQAALAQLS
jgi:predicted nucleotidyltransferase